MGILDTLKLGDDGILDAVFRSWLGRWKLHREIFHDTPGPHNMNGAFEGVATFYPRPPSALPSLDLSEHDTMEYLYHERGTFTSSSGMAFEAQMKYVYRYRPSSDRISVWRVKSGVASGPPENGEIENWFHDITTDVPLSNTDKTWFIDHREKGSWGTHGSEHLCANDLYKPVYKFCFEGDTVSSFGIGYDVKGPAKGYTSESWFERA